MVNKNIQMKQKDGDSWNNLYPLSLNENIYNTDGQSLNEQLENLKNTVDENISDFSNDINASLDIFNSDLGDVKVRVSNIRSIAAYDVDPTGQTDSLNGFKQALADLGDNEELLLHSDGVYLLSDTLELETGKTFNINGNGAELLFDVKGGKNGLHLKGKYKSTKTLSSVLSSGSNELKLNNTTGINRGDIFHLQSPEQFSSTREYYKKGGTFSVSETVSSTQINFTGSFPYDINEGEVHIYEPVTLGLKNITIRNKNAIPNGSHGIEIEFGINSSFDNITLDNFKNNIIMRNMFNTHYNQIVTGRSFYTGSNESYGLALYQSSYTYIANSTFASGRHGLDISGFENSFKTILINVHASFENGSSSYLGLNMHQSAYDLLAINCVFKGFGLSNHATLMNCTLMLDGQVKISDLPDYTNFVFRDCNFDGGSRITTKPDSKGGAHSARYLGNFIMENATSSGSLIVELGDPNFICQYDKVIIEKSKNVQLTVKGTPVIENLIFKEGVFTLDNNMISGTGYQVRNLIIEKMILGARYNLFSITGVITKFIIENCHVKDLGYGNGGIFLKSNTSIGSTNLWGEMIVINTDLSLMPLKLQGIDKVVLINSIMGVSGGTTYSNALLKASFEPFT